MSNAENSLEPQWLMQAQRGDAQAFTLLVEAYQRPVYNLCFRMLGDPYEAEDAAQEAFLRAYDNLKKYDDSRPFSTWLLSIAAHFCIDQIRKRRMVLLSLEDTPYLDPPDLGPGPEASVGQLEVQNQVKTLLTTLSPQDRAAVVLFYWYEFSYEEIAQALRLTVSAVKSRLHRARMALASSWREQESARQAAVLQAARERTNHGKAQSPAFQ